MKKILFVTGSRADYGLLSLLIKKFKKDKRFLTKLVVTGSHLSKKFGSTYKEILKDKLKIDEIVNLKIKGDKPIDICKSISIGTKEFSIKLKKIAPSIVVILGDRYEIFSAAISSLINQIPICHIHGGELTRGSIDDSIRHSITKMSHLHLVANKQYLKRVTQLGENPKNIYCVGGFGVDLINKTKLLKKKQIEEELNFKFGKKNLLVTFHPETVGKNLTKEIFNEILKALNHFKEINIIFTQNNPDIYSRLISKMIKKFVKQNKKRCCFLKSMGYVNYLSTLKNVDGVIGNSSSGLLEAPTLKVGTVNIGDRQKDRLKASSVIDCKPNKNQIIRSINKLYSTKFMKKIKKTRNPYGQGGAIEKSYNIIKNLNFKNLTKKKFYNLR